MFLLVQEVLTCVSCFYVTDLKVVVTVNFGSATSFLFSFSNNNCIKYNDQIYKNSFIDLYHVFCPKHFFKILWFQVEKTLCTWNGDESIFQSNFGKRNFLHTSGNFHVERLMLSLQSNGGVSLNQMKVLLSVV